MKYIYIIKSIYIETILKITELIASLIPFTEISIRIRGAVYRLFMRKAGKNLTMDSHVSLLHIQNLVIGDSVYFAKNVWINSGGDVIIGSNVLLAPMVVISSGNHTFENGLLTKKSIRKPVIIGSNVWVGANCTIIAGSRIGDSVIVAAGSVVLGDIPSNVLVAGNPAKIVKVIC